jgi:arylsulfatase A-like enzyme
MNNTSSGISWGKWAGFLGAFFCLISLRAQTNAANSATVASRPPAPRRPSILLIIADNIGYGDLGCYGQAKVKTPWLDRLASEGVRFTSYYAASPQDELSRASLFTGLEPRHLGASVNHPLPTDALTIATLLKEVGFRTGLLGVWNLGDTPDVEPNTKGFEEFAGFLNENHARDYFSENLYRQETITGSNRLVTIPENWGNAQGRYLPDLLGQMGTRFFQTHAPAKFNHYNANFVCVAYPVPHNTTPPKFSPYSGESWPQPAKDRAAMVSHMDKDIGLLMEALGVWKMETNTIVIFTSIGGAQTEGAMDPKFFSSSGPLRGEAGSVYEGGIRVPMIIRWPAGIKPGQVSDFPCAAWDLLPTLMEAAFMKPPEKTDGLSLLPLLTGKQKPKAHESFYWESTDGETQKAARKGDWKIVQIGTGAPALYNLKSDIGEKKDVAEKNADVLKSMKALLEPAENSSLMPAHIR